MAATPKDKERGAPEQAKGEQPAAEQGKAEQGKAEATQTLAPQGVSVEEVMVKKAEAEQPAARGGLGAGRAVPPGQEDREMVLTNADGSRSKVRFVRKAEPGHVIVVDELGSEITAHRSQIKGGLPKEAEEDGAAQ